jgi:small-conductance mechanosensitive channel
VLLLATWIGSLYLDFPAAAEVWVRRVLVVGFLVQGALWTTGVVNYLVGRHRKRRLEEDPSMATALGAIGVLARIGVWVTFVLLILQNLGVQITALLATLGVGGIAVALAVQNVLGDLFASLSIVLDKPFVLGDFIVVGEHKGTVEHIGLKTTRVRSLSGEQLVFSNSDLLGSRIKNFKRMEDRRIAFSIGVTYDTDRAKLKRIPELIREAVEKQPATRFDRSHFKGFEASSLAIETVFFMLTPDYNAYMDVQQAINLELVERFDEEGIGFAYPTQTVFLERGGSWDSDASGTAPTKLTEGS